MHTASTKIFWSKNEQIFSTKQAQRKCTILCPDVKSASMRPPMIEKDELKKLCYNQDGSVRPKAECRAELINRIILDVKETMDIDEAENYVDKSLREFDLWGEPKLEDLLRDDEEEEAEREKTSEAPPAV